MERELTMPFGKYKGTPFSQLETKYLEWGELNITFREEKYKVAFLAELARRRSGGQPAPKTTPPRENAFSRERIKAAIYAMKCGYRDSPSKTDVNTALDGVLELLDGEPSQTRTSQTDDGMGVVHVPPFNPDEPIPF